MPATNKMHKWSVAYSHNATLAGTQKYWAPNKVSNAMYGNQSRLTKYAKRQENISQNENTQSINQNWPRTNTNARINKDKCYITFI